ncbi:DUF4386 domain-containing protein [bacterium]|nr:DUF4386 domain-containing protein [bacterium]
MPTSAIDESQCRAARPAGVTLILAIVIVVVSNYSVNFRYIVPDIAETARNMVEHATLFRLNIFFNLLYIVTLVLMSTSLYVVLKPVNKNLALTAMFFRLLYAGMWGIIALNTLGAMRLLDDADFLRAFETGQLHALSQLHLRSSWDAYYVALPFWGLASTVCSMLLFKSKYIPRALAAFGIASAAWCAFCALTYIIFPDYGKIVHIGFFDVPLTLFEIVLGFWLLLKGLRPPGIAGLDKAAA